MKVFFQIVGEQGHTFGYLGRLDSGPIVHFIFFVQQMVVPRNYYFLFIFLIRRQGVIWI